MGTTVHVLDDYYLAITFLITVAYQLAFFAVAWTFKFDKVTDFAGGTNFALLAIVTLAFSGQHHARQVVVSLFLIAWALRLSGFLLFRVLKTGKDDRFDDKRDKFFAFLGFWVFQMVWVWVVSLPVTVLNSPNVQQYDQVRFGTGRDIAGIVLFAIGFVMESGSDLQRFYFRQNNDRSAICDRGFFYVSRHPNYFGEIITQFSIYMIAVSSAADGFVQGQAYRALYATIVGPFFLTVLLMFVSGLTLSERPGAKKRYESGRNWEAYQRYLNRTSILIPFPPQIYEHLPTIVKRTIFLEFPLYVFDPLKHSDGAQASQQSSQPAGNLGHQQSAEGLVEEGQGGRTSR